MISGAGPKPKRSMKNPMMPEIEMDMDVESTVTVTDSYDAVADGREHLVVGGVHGVGAQH